MPYRDFATLGAPGCDGPVLRNSLPLPVEFDRDFDLLSCFHVDPRQPAVAVGECSHLVVSFIHNYIGNCIVIENSEDGVDVSALYLGIIISYWA